MYKKNRCLSPHLSVYKAQITSILSIFHRITGFLSVLILFLSSYYYIFFCSFCSIIVLYNILYIFLQFFSFILYSFLAITFFFHMNNGIRHIIWDFGYGLSLDNVIFSGLFVITISSILVFILTLL
jgi:succinate dehydrogenase / fumarate reductase cytochrome b subunit